MVHHKSGRRQAAGHIPRLFLALVGFATVRDGSAFVQLPSFSVSLRPAPRFSMQLSGAAPAKFSLPDASELAFDSAYVGADGSRRGFSNWLLPGSVMVGRYPHGTPFGSKTGRPGAEESREHIRKVLEAGVTTFVCLQEEVPPQDDDAAWNGQEMVPLPDEEKRAKYPEGFQRYYADAEELASTVEGCKALRFIHLPIKDFGTPSESGLSSTLEELAEDITVRDRAVYIHCWGGRGRAGTVGACLLLKLVTWDGATAEEAAAATLALVQAGYHTPFSSKSNTAHAAGTACAEKLFSRV